MTSDFETFRRDRKIRRQKNKTTNRPEGNRAVWEELEEREAKELKEEILSAECDEFFSDATRLVASIVQRVSSDRQQDVTTTLRREMEEFLCDSIRHATNMISNLDWEKAQTSTGEATFESSLKNLASRELDEFRAAGTANLGDKHFGQDPFGTELDGSPILGGVDPQPAPAPAAAAPAPAPVATDSNRIALDCAESDPTGLDPIRRHLSDDELSVSFGTTDPTFQADEFDARISGFSAIQRTEAWVGDEDDEPLAAMCANSDDASLEDDSDVEIDSAQQPEGDAVDSEPDASQDPQPHDAIREALRLLVQAGIMTTEQARAAFRKQTVS